MTSVFDHLSLNHLPFDVLVIIANFLDSESWKAFRIICKRTNNAAVYPYRNTEYLPAEINTTLKMTQQYKKLWIKIPFDPDKILDKFKYIIKTYECRLFTLEGKGFVQTSDIIENTIKFSHETPEVDWSYTFDLIDYRDRYGKEIGTLKINNVEKMTQFQF